jgi:DNA-binding NtrC family response regulator
MRATVLLIEPDDSLRRLLAIFLSKDFRIISTPNGLTALSWFNRGDIPAVILVDAKSSEFTGLPFLSKIGCSGMYCNIPVIALGTLSETDRTTAAAMVNLAGYVEKPVDFESLKQSVHRALKIEEVTTNNPQ